jgi:hypothetical protein
MNRFLRPLYAALLAVALLPAASPLTPAEQALLASIHAGTLKGHVSFLASDVLEGRDTPSRGLDIAAEYIASQFRRFGLQPAAGDSYFQDAPFVQVRQPMDAFSLTLTAGSETYQADPARAAVSAEAALSLTSVTPVVVNLVNEDDPLPPAAQVAGKPVLLFGALRGRSGFEKRAALLRLNPSVLIAAGPAYQTRERLREATAGSPHPASVTIGDPEFARVAALPGVKLSLNIQAPAEEPVQLRNVAAVLPGSDPELSKTYLLLTAHYDHTGVLPRGEGDRINNGANDDASGVATVLALAEAFSEAPQRPRRSIVFMTYFGEEKGLFGSRYYAAHPLFPLARTVANLNFEHMGRTDDNEGPRAGKITATGFDYTTLGESLTEAGKLTGVEAWKHERNSDGFFGSSDNQPLAGAGIPAITVAVAWIFPDYHRPGDEWQKLDYPNMEKAVRTAALTAERIADSAQAPRWIESNPKTAAYYKAWQHLHGQH